MSISFTELFVLLACVWGVTLTINHGEIMDIMKLRPLWKKWWFTEKAFKCALCTGTYVGVIIGLVYIPWNYWIPFIFASSSTSFVIDNITMALYNWRWSLPNPD